MSTLASSNRVHCTRANESDDMLVRGVRVPVATEGREESAEAVPEQEVQEQEVECVRLWRGGDGIEINVYGNHEKLPEYLKQALWAWYAESHGFRPVVQLRAVAEAAREVLDDQADGFK